MVNLSWFSRLNLSDYAGQFVDDEPASTPPDRAESIAVFTRIYGGSLERIGETDKFLMLLSILDYLGTKTNTTGSYTMQEAACYQDGDGFLAGAIDSDEWALLDWLNHFAELDQQNESNGLLWGIAATLFEALYRGGCE